MTTVYVPRDSAARSVGADEVAVALTAEAARRGDDLRLVRNGSRGMLWLEPMVEVDVDGTRVAYGPVGAEDVAGLLDAGLLSGGDHALRLGPTDDLEWIRRQDRVTFARVGLIDPLDLDDYQRHGGLAGLRAALELTPQD
ncbi:MAG: formate dehydrogenase, partial [Actinomycetota bacterium]|nr:formate dehydrogenase [Actinomycetota bacterium]